MATKPGQDDVRQHSGCHRCRCCVRCRCRPRNSSDAKSCPDNNSFLAVCRPTNLVQDDDPQHSGGVRSCWCVQCRCRSRNCSNAESCTVKFGKGVASAGVVASAGGAGVGQGHQVGGEQDNTSQQVI